MARKKILTPTYKQLIEPTYSVMKELGGLAINDEIRDKIIVFLNFSDKAVDEPHKGSASQRTELEYQFAWTRTYLKNYGAIENTKRGVWVITSAFAGTPSVDAKEVEKRILKKERTAPTENDTSTDDGQENDRVEPPEIFRTSKGIPDY